VAYSNEKPMDKNKIISQIIKDLKRVGILRLEDRICVQDINDIKYGYPIYDFNYKESREKILRYLLQNEIISCGRYGSWQYMTMEGALLDGERAVNIIVNLG
jgi:protoporphyrinogen oxidase